MNILQLTNKVPFPPIDGGAIATLNMSETFIKLGHNVTILAMNTSKHHTSTEDIEKYNKNNINIICVDVNTDIYIHKAILNLAFSSIPYNAERFLSKNYKNQLVELLRNNKFDIIQLEGFYLALYIPYIRKYTDALISMRAHNIEHEIWERIVQNESSTIKKLYLNIISKRIKKLEVNMLKKYDVLIPITKRDESIFIKLGCKIPVHTSPSGIDINNFNNINNITEEFSLFYIGALDWIPNQQGLKWFFDNIWGNIISKFNNIKFYVAGRNAPDWLINYINNKNAIYVGEVKNAYDFIRSKSIMIVPLLSGSGMRIKIIEGMALGKTIITTSIGTEGINSKHNENILIADSPEDFSSEIEKVILNHSICNIIGNNASKFIKANYNNTTICSLLTNFYNEQLIKHSRNKTQ